VLKLLLKTEGNYSQATVLKKRNYFVLERIKSLQKQNLKLIVDSSLSGSCVGKVNLEITFS